MARPDDVAGLEEFGRFGRAGTADPRQPRRRSQARLRGHRRHRVLRRRTLRARIALRRDRQARIAWPDRGARHGGPAQSLPAHGGRRESAARAARQHAVSGEGRPEAAGEGVTWLIRLYPPAWRRRYGRELAELLAAQPASFRTAVDLVAGAVDAWLNPQLSTAVTAARCERSRSDGPKMLKLRSAGYGANVTTADPRQGRRGDDWRNPRAGPGCAVGPSAVRAATAISNRYC